MSIHDEHRDGVGAKMFCLFSNGSRNAPAFSNTSGETWNIVVSPTRVMPEDTVPVWEMVEDSEVEDADDLDLDGVSVECVEIAKARFSPVAPRIAVSLSDISDMLDNLAIGSRRKLRSWTICRVSEDTFAAAVRVRGRRCLADMSMDEAAGLVAGKNKVVLTAGNTFEVRAS